MYRQLCKYVSQAKVFTGEISFLWFEAAWKDLLLEQLSLIRGSPMVLKSPDARY